MLTLIHGDDKASSRRKLAEEKDKHQGFEVISLDGTKLQLPELTLALQSSSFFSSKKLIAIENLLTGRIDKEKQKIISCLASDSYADPVIIWEGKVIEKGTVKKYFPKAREILCQLPQLLFKFLDSLGERSSSELISNLHHLLAGQEAEFIFVMMLRQFRLLILVKGSDKKEATGLPSWQMHKLMHQANYFPLPQLIYLYRQLLAIDYKIKTGKTPLNLTALLDIFLSTL